MLSKNLSGSVKYELGPEIKVSQSKNTIFFKCFITSRRLLHQEKRGQPCQVNNQERSHLLHPINSTSWKYRCLGQPCSYQQNDCLPDAENLRSNALRKKAQERWIKMGKKCWRVVLLLQGGSERRKCDRHRGEISVRHQLCGLGPGWWVLGTSAEPLPHEQRQD